MQKCSLDQDQDTRHTELSVIAERLSELQSLVVSLQEILKTKNNIIAMLLAHKQTIVDDPKSLATVSGNPNLEITGSNTSQATGDAERQHRDASPLYNKFSVLRDCDSEAIVNSNPAICFQEIKIGAKRKSPRKRRVLIVSESHGRGYGRRMQENLGDSYQVTRFVKPGAGLK